MPSPNESQRVVALPSKKPNENNQYMKSTHDDDDDTTITTMKRTQAESDFAALIGLDWGSEMIFLRKCGQGF